MTTLFDAMKEIRIIEHQKAVERKKAYFKTKKHKAYLKKYMKEYQKTAKYKAYMRAYHQRKGVKK